MPEFEAVVLAGGFSSRMTGFKPLLPMAGATPLERAISLFRDQVDRVLVVTGHRAEELAPIIENTGATAVYNPDHASGMFSSILAGVQALADNTPAFFLLPVDIPLVRPATLRRLIEAFVPGQTLALHPCFQGEPGHPPLLAAELRQAILDHDGQGGLRAVLERIKKERPDTVLDMATPDQGILLDMDTDQDHAALCERAQRPGLPTPAECVALMDLVGTPAQTREHCRAVAKVAVAMARELNREQASAPDLDTEVIQRAAMMHDLAKGHKHHEQAGADILSREGFTDIAQAVALHRDMVLPDSEPINESALVFLADKLVAGTTVVPLKQRYGAVLTRHGHDPEARLAIETRLAHGLAVADRVEAAMGRPLYELAQQTLETREK